MQPENFPTIFAITEDEIDLNELLAQITLTSTGAGAIFTGMVRGETKRGDAHDTEYLEYEAYVPMAEAKMKQVADEIRAKWPIIEGIAIVQRIGKLYPKTPTVLIACTAAHRDTGVFEAAVKAVETVDQCNEAVTETARKNGYSIIIIADHGNADMMINDDGTPNTAHTTNLVPCILVDDSYTGKMKDGKLGDLAPTILTLMGIPIPKEMTGTVLIDK